MSDTGEIELADSDAFELEIKRIYAAGTQVFAPDPRQPSDPVFTEMVRLASLQPETRRRELEPYMLAWLDMRTDRLTVARYLATSGLTYEEAEALEAVARQGLNKSIRLEAYTGVCAGLALFIAGAWVAILRVFPFWGLMCCVLAAAGLTSLARGIGLMRRIAPPN